MHSFTFANGMQPRAGLLRDGAGNLYGTTMLGGDTRCYKYGCGTVFELDKTGTKEKVLHKFAGGVDEFFPESLLAKDAAGNLYGTTSQGSVFKVDMARKETVLYNFLGGCDPGPGAILDAAGNLYGVGTGCEGGYGEVFELDTTGTLTILHAFGGGDGAQPISVLLFDSRGNLYAARRL